jgi:plastocyanin
LATSGASPVPASPPPGIPVSDASLTPVPTPPTPEPTPLPTPDPQTILETELLATARALAACLSDGPPETVADLATEDYLGQLYAGGEPLAIEDYLLLAPDLNPIPVRILDVTDAAERGGDATAEVVSVVGNQLLTEEWRFTTDEVSGRSGAASRWRVAAATTLRTEPPPGAADLDLTLAEYSISIEPSTPAGSDVVLRGTNAGAEDHEMLVLRFDSGFTITDLLRTTGPALPDEARWIGQVVVPAGETADLILTDLDPGTYTIVCLLPTVRGTPHLALGMAATFTVE